MTRSFLWLQLFLLLLLLNPYHSIGHESCCKHKLSGKEAVAVEFIDDPTDSIPPEEFEGEKRLLIDPDDVRPAYWDDEDDGPWEPNLILNPKYQWKPRQIRNPNYIPPPTFWTKLFAELQMALPWVTLGIIVTGLATCCLALPPYRFLFEQWKTFVTNPESSTIGKTFVAAILGLATPLCSCGALPVAAGFWKEGIPPSSVVAFLTASQSAGLDSAFITWGLLGPTAVLCRLTGAMALAMVAGGCLSGTEASKPNTTNKSTTKLVEIPNDSLVRLLFTTLLDTTLDILPTLLIGLALSTGLFHFVPGATSIHSSFFQNKNNTISSILLRWIVLASALPLQVCEHTTVALAAAIQKAGGSPGLAFGFLLSAPATNLPTLLLLTNKMGATRKKTSSGIFLTIQTGLAISLTALIFSYMVDLCEIDLLVQEEAKVVSSSSMASLPDYYLAASPWLAGGLVFSVLVRSLYSKYSSPSFVMKDESCCQSDCSPSNHKKNN